jgi:rubrerythrin
MNRDVPEYKSLLDILQDAVNEELEAERFYTAAADLATSDDIRSFLLELADMERDHAVQLGRRLESLQADQTILDGIRASYGEGEDPNPA